MNKPFQVVFLYNGTGADDNSFDDEPGSNVVRFRDEMVQDDTQIAVYENGIGKDRVYTSTTLQKESFIHKLIGLFDQATGGGAISIAKDSFKELAEHIKSKYPNIIQKGSTIECSTVGFSRGAAIARYVANEVIHKGALKQILYDIGVEVEVVLKAQYLFDTVEAFSKLYPAYKWDVSIPLGTKAYQALAIDEKRKIFLPTQIPIRPGETEEVWFDGDHTSVGGGWKLPPDELISGQELPLRYMMRRAMKNGLVFKNGPYHLDEYNDSNHPIGFIKTDPPFIFKITEHVHREICSYDDNGNKVKPLVSYRVERRILATKDSKQKYDPKNFKKLVDENIPFDYFYESSMKPSQDVLKSKL